MTERKIKAIPTKILLPTDFSPSSHAALKIAADLAQHFSATLYLFTIIPMISEVNGANFFAETEAFQMAKRNAEESLAACKATLPKSISMTCKVDCGNDVVARIHEEIKNEQIDMLILSTHGMTGWRPLVFGSIAEQLVRAVECPLLLLRSVK